METEGRLIIVPKFKGNLFQKNHKINKLKKILFYFIFIIIFILIGAIVFVFLNITYKNSINLSNEKLLKLKNDLQSQISNLEKMILKEQNGKLNKTSNNELLNIISFNYEENEKFNQNINDRYIKEQNYFCENQINLGCNYIY